MKVIDTSSRGRAKRDLGGTGMDSYRKVETWRSK
jgi:hypothetical protein